MNQTGLVRKFSFSFSFCLCFTPVTFVIFPECLLVVPPKSSTLYSSKRPALVLKVHLCQKTSSNCILRTSHLPTSELSKVDKFSGKVRTDRPTDGSYDGSHGAAHRSVPGTVGTNIVELYPPYLASTSELRNKPSNPFL